MTPVSKNILCVWSLLSGKLKWSYHSVIGTWGNDMLTNSILLSHDVAIYQIELYAINIYNFYSVSWNDYKLICEETIKVKILIALGESMFLFKNKVCHMIQ